MSLRTVLCSLLVAPLVACASHAAAPPPSTAAEDNGPVVGPPEVAWKDLSKEQRAHFMKRVVMPKMSALFAAEAPEPLKDKFSCVTCHGGGAKEKTFKMPNPDLPKLPNSPEGWEKLKAKEPAWLKFMAMRVKPEMAAILGLPSFDPEHPQEGAFGCGNCHVTEGAPPAP